jgi:AraC family transcriptional regulator
MSSNTIYIKNMVCPRCVQTVEQLLDRLAIPYESVETGEAQIGKQLTADELRKLEEALTTVGFELIETRQARLMEAIRIGIRDYLSARPDISINLSEFLTARIAYDYSYMSDLFSSAEGISIEQYFIRLRIEKVKELLVYDELSLSEIAYRTGFSSVHHLSAQFKKQTGLTPKFFRQVALEKRKARKG